MRWFKRLLITSKMAARCSPALLALIALSVVAIAFGFIERVGLSSAGQREYEQIYRPDSTVAVYFRNPASGLALRDILEEGVLPRYERVFVNRPVEKLIGDYDVRVAGIYARLNHYNLMADQYGRTYDYNQLREVFFDQPGEPVAVITNTLLYQTGDAQAHIGQIYTLDGVDYNVIAELYNNPLEVENILIPLERFIAQDYPMEYIELAFQSPLSGAQQDALTRWAKALDPSAQVARLSRYRDPPPVISYFFNDLSTMPFYTLSVLCVCLLLWQHIRYNPQAYRALFLFGEREEWIFYQLLTQFTILFAAFFLVGIGVRQLVYQSIPLFDFNPPLQWSDFGRAFLAFIITAFAGSVATAYLCSKEILSKRW